MLDVGYEYNINSDRRLSTRSILSHSATALAAYVYGYGAESTALNITQETPGGTPVYTDPDGHDGLAAGHITTSSMVTGLSPTICTAA